MAEISVPVKLLIQNLLSLVNELLSKLGNLKVGSTGFKAILNTIASIRGEIDKLSILTAKPFIDASQFTKAEHAVENLEEDIEKVGIVMSRLKFSDLELTSGLKADIKAFEDQLTSIKDKLKVIKNTAKDEFLNSALGQEWLKIDETAFSKTLTQITNNIRTAVAELNNELNKLELSALDYLRALTENLRIKDFISKNTGDPLSLANLGDLYDKIFTTTAKGLFRYTSNGRNLLADWLENQLHLDDSVITQIINKNVSAANVGEKLKEVLNNLVQLNQRTVDNNPNVTAAVDAAKVKYDELIAILKQVGISEESVAATELVLRSAFSLTTGEFNNYKEKLLSIALSNSSVQNTTNAMKSQLESLRTTLASTNSEFIRMQRTLLSFNLMKMAVVNFMGFNQVLNLTKNAIRNAINHIKELDSVMNKISIVTDMSTSDLWELVDAYSKMALTYGVSIKGAYEVSLIYYQLGLETNDVLTLTNETLKLARISGLDYALTTDYMTTALRGFKMEMSEASTVVDVYSNLASHTAVSLEELAVAMSKTASSMESVGATFEEASAMIATMVAVTRESATNIGSAMKSIASRYGELTKDPTKLVDEEGEAMAFNKVDAALQSVGISMRTVDGLFREFTDVIVELGEKWDLLESTQLRYIATLFAGNRQQSRFLALVSNVDLLKANMGYAEESEDTGTLLALKALDSIEAKTELVRVAYQLFYTTIGAESVWKGFLDGAKNVINTLNSFPKLFGKLPVGAIAAVTNIVLVIKKFGVTLISHIAEVFGKGIFLGMQSASNSARAGANTLFNTINDALKSNASKALLTGSEIGLAVVRGAANPNLLGLSKSNLINYLNNKTVAERFGNEQDNAMALAKANVLLQLGKITQEEFNLVEREGAVAALRLGAAYAEKNTKLVSATSRLASGFTNFGSALLMVSLLIDTSKPGMKTLGGTIMGLSGIILATGGVWQGFITSILTGNSVLSSIPWTAVIAGVMAAINGIATLWITPEEKLKELEDRAEELNNKAKEAKANYRTLDNSVTKYHELEEARYDSAEAAEEYQEAVDKIVEAYPALIESYTIEGEAILNASALELTLTEARNAAADATFRAAKAEAEKAKQEKVVKENDLKKANDIFDDYAQTDFFNKHSSTWENYRNADGTPMTLAQYVQFGGTTGDKEILSKLLEMDRAVEELNVEGILLANDELNDLLIKYNVRLSEKLTKERDKIIETALAYSDSDRVISAADRGTVSTFLNAQYGKSDSNSVFKENSAILRLATDLIYNDINESEAKDFSEENLLQKSLLYLSKLETAWTDLTDIQIEELNKVLSNPDHYTGQDLQKLADKYHITIEEWMVNAFNNRLNINTKALESKVTQMKDRRFSENVIEGATKRVTDLAITLDERKLMTLGLNLVDNLRLDNLDYDDFFDQFLEVYDSIIGLPADIRNLVIAEFTENGFTKEGLLKTLDYIKTNKIEGVSTEKIDDIIKGIIPNINLAIETAENELINNLDGIESITASLQGGINGSKLEKTITEAKQYGINLSRDDFEKNGEKFVLKYERLTTEINALRTRYTEQFDTSALELDLAAAAVHENIGNINAARIALGGRFTEFYKKDQNGNWVLDTEVDITNFYNELDNTVDKTKRDLYDYLGLVNTVTALMAQSAAWKHGDYSSLTTLGLKSGSYSTGNLAYARIAYLAAHQDEMTEEELNAPDIINAVESYLKGIGLVISDISIHDADYIKKRANLYEGVAETTVLEIANKLESGELSTIGAIREYAAEAGKTVYEINELIADSITKNTKIGAMLDAASLISGLSFNMNDLTAYIKKYKPESEADISSFIDDNGNIINEALAPLYELDVATGQYKLTNEATLEKVISAWSKALDIEITKGSDIYNDLVNLWANDVIAEADKNDEGKQIASTLSNIASASRGTRINASKLTPELKRALRVSDNGIYKVMSEYKRDQALLALDANDLTDPESQTLLRQILKNLNSKYSKSKGLKGIMSSVVDSDAMRSFILNNIFPDIDISKWTDEDILTSAYNRGYIWDEYTLSYRATTRALNIINQQIEDAIKSEASEETIAELRKLAASLEQELTHDKKRDALSNLLTNYQDAESALSEFYAQFGAGFSKDELRQKGILTTNELGKEIIDINKLNEAIDGYDDLFKTAIELMVDEYISNAQKAGSLFTRGTTSRVEMSGFQEAYKKLTRAEVEFIFDPLLSAWTIDVTNLRTYLSKAAETLGLDKSDLLSWVEELIKTLIIDNLDFSGYLSGTNTVKENQILRKNLTDYFKDKSQTKGFLSLDELNEWIKDLVDTTFENLSLGGLAAIDALRSIKGELTQEEIESAYRAQIKPIKALMDLLNELQIGSIVAKNLIDALNTAGFKVNTDGVIISTGNLVAAYKSLYDLMKATNEATIAELNTALGKYLDSRDGEQVVIDALSNATSMTYSQLAEIYTLAGIELTESMINELEASGIIKGLGGNKMMIQDFESFAASMGWNADSEEYVKAFKAYNDSLILLDNATEKAILEEVNAVLKANPGDKVNLTYLANQLHLAAGEIWELEGATLKDGILSIENGANIGNITNQLIALARSSTENIEEELEELAYAVLLLLADIANTIKNGISGSLKRDEAKKVTDWASQYGVKVDFNETAEGLLITSNSARELYNTINAIDRLLGQVVFEALKDNLIKTDERFQSTSANAAYIAKLERDITKEITKKNNNDKFDDTKINQYKKELELAQKINETRGLTEDSSFKFMEQDIPSGLKNPLNYWSNWGKAFTVMNESRTNGTMAYEDFRNIITEMGNLVDITDLAITLGGLTLNNSKEAASLIEAAAGALEVQTDGSLKVNLKKIGVEFLTGSESMTNGIDKGIQEIANSLIEMLDSLIGLLEVIVLMEQLSDLDLDSDMQLDLSEIFNDGITDFNDDWKSALTKWRDMMTEGSDTFNEDFKRGMESIKFTINGELVSLAQVIGADFNKLDDLHISPQLYQAIMNGLYESVRSGDFSEENVKELIMQNLLKHLSELTDEPIVFDMGNYTFIGSGNASFDIDWTADNTKKALEWIDDSVENKKLYLIDAFAARGKGEANTTQLLATLITDGVLTIKNNKPTVILKDYNGRSQAFTSDDALYAEALQAKMLELVGAKEIKLGTIGTSAAVGELNVGQATLTVRSFKGLIQYLSEETNQWYPTLSDLIAAEAGDNEEAKEQLEIKYGLKVVPLIEVDENQYRLATEKQILEILAAILSRDLGEVQKLAALIGVKINKDETTATAAEWKEIEKQFDIETKTVTLKGDTEDAETKVDNVQEKLDKLIENKDQTISIEMHETNYGTTVSALNTINDLLQNIAKNRNQQINITTVKTTVENESKKPGNKKSPPKNNAYYTEDSEATGNVALSKGTLMGELGPELVVSKGRYYIVGQNGPEFVDLEEDAIVFNHLLTKSLLQRGITFGRGAPVTNERNAVAFAGGNITGPAMASASSILSILKELRAMWKSLLQSSTKDLAGLGGSGRGGGGGKNSNADNAAKAGEFTKELEKWYNWLLKISILGKKLNYEEKLRSKIASDMYSHGLDYTASQLKSLDYLQSLIAVEKSLVASQKEYFEKRRKELNESPMGALYTFDEYGQLKYNNGTFGAFAKLLETDKNNKPTFSAKDLYEILVEAGYGDYMKYNQSGEEITKETETNSSGETVEKADQSAYYKNAVLAFWDKVDSDKNEMQSLRDSIELYEAEILEKMTEANEIMKEIEDNQISVEEKVLKAIEDTREREIEELLSTRDAMEEAANELISGLSDLLSKEKDMYALQESQDELTKLQRLLAILLRSGGSASLIAGLLKEITLKLRDAYFEALQRQIDALLAASNAELERLDNLIELMNETLAYLKLHGLLWEEVYLVLLGTPEEITDYIIQNTREYWGESPTKLTLDTRGILTEVLRFTAFRDTVKNGMDELINKFSDKTLELMAYDETVRMNAEINNKLGEGALKIVDAINAKEISLNLVINNNYEAPASTPTGGDTGSGTDTGATLSTGGELKKDHRYTVWLYNREFTANGFASETEARAAAEARLEQEKRNLQKELISNSHIPASEHSKILAAGTIKEAYKQGGIVDYTGPAWVDGTKSKPESVLTSEQTSILRNDILSNKPTSLLSLLTDFRDAYNSIPNASAYSTVNNGGVTIENATVEMNVSKISNDYDAQRAGEQALEKMMQIARKTSALNRIGR